MTKSTMTPGNKGTLSPVALQGGHGQFGLKRKINVPPELKTEEDKPIDDVEKASEIGETEIIPELKEESLKVKPTMNVSEEEVKIEGIQESFECPVCGKEFSKRIALTGHLRGPCGKKK